MTSLLRYPIASSIERQTTPGVPSSFGDVIAYSLLTKVDTLNLGFDQKERDNADVSPTTMTPAPQELQKIRRSMAENTKFRLFSESENLFG